MTTRRELWTAIDASIRSSYPEKGGELTAALEGWLEPSPWSLGFTAAEKRAVPRMQWTRDRLLAEVARALRAVQPDQSERYQGELEGWLLEFPPFALRAHLALRHILSGVAWEPTILEWAASALEARLDTPSLRRLASLHPGNPEIASTTMEAARELGIEPSRERELHAARLLIAREIVQGRIDAATGAFRFASLADDVNATVAALQTDPDELGRNTLNEARTILANAGSLTSA